MGRARTDTIEEEGEWNSERACAFCSEDGCFVATPIVASRQPGANGSVLSPSPSGTSEWIAEPGATPFPPELAQLPPVLAPSKLPRSLIRPAAPAPLILPGMEHV